MEEWLAPKCLQMHNSQRISLLIVSYNWKNMFLLQQQNARAGNMELFLVTGDNRKDAKNDKKFLQRKIKKQEGK